MKFRFLLLLVLGHSMTCYDNSKISFIVIFMFHAKTEPIVEEPLLQPLPSWRDGEGACDVTEFTEFPNPNISLIL